jgi:serine/threonine protein kinase
MKLCPACRNTYPDDYQTCPRDQALLVAVSSEIVKGTVLRGKYEVLGELGAGGMATVYQVRHRAFHELAAIKVVHPHFMSDPSFAKRFRNEAVVARQLKHPNAVRIDDFDYTEDGRPFIVMEFVEGRSLYEMRKELTGSRPTAPATSQPSVAKPATAANQPPPGVSKPASAEPAKSRTLNSQAVLSLLQQGLSPKRVTTLVNERGVTFSLTAPLEKQLRSAGADDALLLAIATHKKSQ